MYIEPMYRGPSRGPCIRTIYPTLLGFGGIQAIILSLTVIAPHCDFFYICHQYNIDLTNVNDPFFAKSCAYAHILGKSL